ncbi:MAG: AraC family ligand binding domain-containing protein [Clostridia bacterium]|nr:AraC family ligand binding domain-containing protein [Clostridia bacterium]
MQSQIKPNALLRYRRYNREHNFIFGGHSHANWEIDIILKGTFEVTVDDSVLILPENTLILYESDVFHRSRIISKGRAEDVVIHFTCKTLPKNVFTGVYELSDTDMGLMQVLMEEAEKEPRSGMNFVCRQMNSPSASKRFLKYSLKELRKIKLNPPF